MDQPWINLQNYTLTEVILFLIGALLWAYAYIAAVIRNHRYQTLAIPLAAVCLNFGWEVSSVFFFRSGIDMGKLFVLGYALWMGIDAIIVTQMFRYGHTQISAVYVKKHLPVLLTIGLIGSILGHSFFMTEGFDMPMAVISAYLINLAMSIDFCGLAFKPNFHGLSTPIAWAKGIGTGLISICFFLKYPHIHFLTTMYILTALFDGIYLYLLYQVVPTLTSDPQDARSLPTADLTP
ncbi:MAG: hypothetical protein AAF215_04540 [Cyanobacteria bacterium P01_A01_bin.123]